VRDAYREALDTLIELGAERALILQGPAPLRATLTHGFESDVSWSDQVSLSLLERSLEGEPLLVADINETPMADRWSVQVSGIRSVVCVPFWSPSSRVLGLIYADTRSMKEAFSRSTMNAVLSAARRLERTLYGGAIPGIQHRGPIWDETPKLSEPVSETGISLGLRRQAPRPKAVAPVASPSVQQLDLGKLGRPNERSLVVFLRSLSTLINAGISIHRALTILGQHESDLALRQTCQFLAARVSGGNNLSSSMSQCPQIFQRFDCSIIQVGERSGALDRVLVELAQLRERQFDSKMQLRSALVYPAFLCSLSMAALLLAPPFVLRGQMELMRQLGQQPPLLTKAFILLSDILSSPLGWLAIAAAVGSLAWTMARHPQLREKLQDRISQLPVLKRLLLHSGCARFAHGLALTYKVGIPIDQCLSLATRLSGLRALEDELPLLLAGIKGGLNFSETLSQSKVLPHSFAALTRAGEESGKLDTLLEWISKFYEMEFETNLESLLSMLQPILILTMGVMIGLLLLATLLPMVSLVQQL
jgi:type II secretory pathway component PulF